MHHLCIAIDGPAGAGKSTVAKEVARRLGIVYVDTGAMYRAVAWLALRHGVSPADEQGLIRLLRQHELRFERNGHGMFDVYVDGANITSELRTPEVSAAVSQLSAHPEIRRILTEWQRSFSRSQSVVMDGRDIGTVVMPDAPVKIYLTADIRERARRRADELAAKGFSVSVEELLHSLRERDERDTSRACAPLRRPDDAICIDSTDMTVDEVVERILSIVRQVHHG
ncbi:cytidylate kinase [Alicyclobacillus cellulosilyticus]|uniref:Cytidylate kinase n=1 Tax=Alicyclobacillus cellulosilyticus TaxID=1003997 RepID=A0A917KDS7_9BACL|nr:(d)CMP kinase [Alicyclobacillus cellulosilyticus]GGJ10277.1 cytidylate kinase [Alicyclobacillus cellulosilyticus]